MTRILAIMLCLFGQIPRSQHGSVTQRVGTTDIAISYNRPVARGRTLFGDDGVGRRKSREDADVRVTSASFGVLRRLPASRRLFEGRAHTLRQKSSRMARLARQARRHRF